MNEWMKLKVEHKENISTKNDINNNFKKIRGSVYRFSTICPTVGCLHKRVPLGCPYTEL